ISVDSRQIYQEMDIGTNKEPGEIVNGVYVSQGIPHHLISIVPPDQTLTLADIQQLAFKVIGDILKRGKQPVLVGGTGLYVSAILENWQLPKGIPDPDKRKA